MWGRGGRLGKPGTTEVGDRSGAPRAYGGVSVLLENAVSQNSAVRGKVFKSSGADLERIQGGEGGERWDGGACSLKWSGK